MLSNYLSLRFHLCARRFLCILFLWHVLWFELQCSFQCWIGSGNGAAHEAIPWGTPLLLTGETETMNGRDRVLSAFRHEEADKVPRWCGASAEFWSKAKQDLNLDDEALRIRFGDDFRRVFAPCVETDALLDGISNRSPFWHDAIDLGHDRDLLVQLHCCGFEPLLPNTQAPGCFNSTVVRFQPKTDSASRGLPLSIVISPIAFRRSGHGMLPMSPIISCEIPLRPKTLFATETSLNRFKGLFSNH